MRLRIVLLGLLTLAAGPALAEETPAPPPPIAGARPAQARELLEQVMIARLSRELALDDAQTVVLVRRYAEARERLVELRRRRNDAKQALEQALRESASEEIVAEKLQALQAIDDELVALRQKGFDDIAGDLTTWQQARLYLFFSEFEESTRRMVQEVQQRMRGPRGPGEEGRPGPPRKRNEGAARADDAPTETPITPAEQP